MTTFADGPHDHDRLEPKPTPAEMSDKELSTQLDFVEAHLFVNGKPEMSKFVFELRRRFEQLREDVKAMREMLWISHGCRITALYGDDGEMQCKQCGIDFKRATPNEIASAFVARGKAALAATSQPDVDRKVNNED
jgi:hypothetical protein